MESLIDVITTSFQAVLTVCVVFTAGYAYNGDRQQQVGTILATVSKKVLLPCLVFATLATSPHLTWHSLLMQWPIAVMALTTHILSIAISLLIRRFGKTEDWVVDALVFNNVSSFPLLLLYAFHRVTPGAGIEHLKWRIMDKTAKVVERLMLYILVNLLVTELARTVISPILRRVVERMPIRGLSNEDDETNEPAETETFAEDEVVDEADERTPLVARQKPTGSQSLRAKLLSPLPFAAVAGLLVGLIKPLQRVVVGDADNGGNWFWLSVGSAFIALGSTFAVVDTLALGAGIRAGEKPKSAEDKVPPTLGTVLVIVLWRFVAIPAAVLSIVYGFRKIPSTRVFLQDPSFSFVLAITAFTPPVLPSSLNPYRSSVLFSVFYTSLITALPIALAFAITGRGISYATDFDLTGALKSAAGGGIAGAAAMVVQVLTLMPMRTIMNYQYRNGGSLKDVARKLYSEGGFKRYYAGLAAALFQGPLSRFGDTAANAGIIALLDGVSWPVLVKTVAASVASATFRMTLTPIDTIKTTQQTQGSGEGMRLLRQRIREKGVASLWYGAIATAAATFVGHYPWYGTYNYLQDVLPPPHTLVQKLLRQALIGFTASVISDTASNSLRVVKTYRQVHEGDVGYWTAAKDIVATEGLLGLFGRGLPTRLMTNGLQGLLFSILWKLFADLIAGNGK